MSKKRTRKTVPSYRLHKASENAYVELGGKRIYLGKHGTPESREAYHRTLAEWEANGRTLPVAADTIIYCASQIIIRTDIKEQSSPKTRRKSRDRDFLLKNVYTLYLQGTKS